MDISCLFAGLMSWDDSSCHVDLAKELDIITECSPPGEEQRGGIYHISSQESRDVTT